MPTVDHNQPATTLGPSLRLPTPPILHCPKSFLATKFLYLILALGYSSVQVSTSVSTSGCIITPSVEVSALRLYHYTIRRSVYPQVEL